MVTHILAFGNWPISAMFVLFIYALLTGITPRPFPRSVWLLALALGQLAGYFFIYLITPHDLQIHINTSIDRLISHVFPLFVLWLFSLLRLPDTESHSPEGEAGQVERETSFVAHPEKR